MKKGTAVIIPNYFQIILMNFFFSTSACLKKANLNIHSNVNNWYEKICSKCRHLFWTKHAWTPGRNTKHAWTPGRNKKHVSIPWQNTAHSPILFPPLSTPGHNLTWSDVGCWHPGAMTHIWLTTHCPAAAFRWSSIIRLYFNKIK